MGFPSADQAFYCKASRVGATYVALRESLYYFLAQEGSDLQILYRMLSENHKHLSAFRPSICHTIMITPNHLPIWSYENGEQLQSQKTFTLPNAISVNYDVGAQLMMDGRIEVEIGRAHV